MCTTPWRDTGTKTDGHGEQLMRRQSTGGGEMGILQRRDRQERKGHFIYPLGKFFSALNPSVVINSFRMQ